MAFLSLTRRKTLLIISILVILGMVLKFWEYSPLTYTIGIFLFLFIHKANERYCFERKINTSNKAVLITGCDTGFGNLLAKRLDSKGFHVFATCLFPDGAGANDLRQTCSNNLQVLPLDVTKDESVTNALTFVKENLRSNVLWAVVNNAGIVKGFSFDFSTIRHFKDTLYVNVLGPVRVTKAFLPLLKESKGRLVNIASISGRLAATDICAYDVSKHALVGLSECLRLEMIPWNIQVISIEPEIFGTRISDGQFLVTRLEDEMKDIDEDTLNDYGTEYVRKLKEMIFKVANSACDDINVVVDAMETAVSDANPHPVYKPCRSLLMSLFIFVLENMPAMLFDKAYTTVARLIGYPQL